MFLINWFKSFIKALKDDFHRMEKKVDVSAVEEKIKMKSKKVKETIKADVAAVESKIKKVTKKIGEDVKTVESDIKKITNKKKSK